MGAGVTDSAIPAGVSLVEAIRAIAESAGRTEAVQTLGNAGARVLNCAGALVLRPPSEGRLKLAYATDADIGSAALEVEDSQSRGIFRLVLDGGKPVLSNDLLTDPRFHRYSTALAARTSMTSLLGVPLRLADEDLGALVLYSDTPQFFDLAACERAQSFACLAAVALSRVIQHEQGANVLLALDTNREIGIALGIIMTSNKISHDMAFDRMKRASQNQHRKLRDIAADVVFTGQLDEAALVPVTRSSAPADVAAVRRPDEAARRG